MLLKERSKNHEFLYKSLPKPVGDAIIEGKMEIVPYDVPEQALLMITIHHFTQLGYTPEQNIDILNDFYKLVEKVKLQRERLISILSMIP